MQNDYQRVEESIKYLETNFREQPSLEDLTQHLNLSPFHLQRLFKRWAGISPKRFLQFLTTDYAKSLLDESKSVLDVTYEAGLSSPSRLHDLFINVEAVTPGEYKMMGHGLQITYGFQPTPFGTCLIATTDKGICHLSFLGETEPHEALAQLEAAWPNAILIEGSAAVQPIVAQIFPTDETTGQRTINLFLKGTNFQIKVWEALLNIPAGSVCAYGDIAERIGKPEAMRAVGSAVGRNPVAYLIPCHRVIRKNGAFGHYRWSTTRKKAILGWEAARKFNKAEMMGEAVAA